MKRLATLVTVTCLLVSTALPVLAADPIDPAGNPVDADGSTDPGDSVTQEVTQQVHATFERGDVFVAVSNGKVQWRLPDGTLNATLDTGEGGFTTGMAFDDRGHLFLRESRPVVTLHQGHPDRCELPSDERTARVGVSLRRGD